MTELEKILKRRIKTETHSVVQGIGIVFRFSDFTLTYLKDHNNYEMVTITILNRSNPVSIERFGKKFLTWLLKRRLILQAYHQRLYTKILKKKERMIERDKQQIIDSFIQKHI